MEKNYEECKAGYTIRIAGIDYDPHIMKNLGKGGHCCNVCTKATLDSTDALREILFSTRKKIP